jgi:hypothetical protein
MSCSEFIRQLYKGLSKNMGTHNYKAALRFYEAKRYDDAAILLAYELFTGKLISS